MRIFISGVCGFVGSELAKHFVHSGHEVVGMDNLTRPGSWTNVEPLRKLDVNVVYGDVRSPSDFESLGPVDWVIDAAATPSVLAGVGTSTSSRQLVETNLIGTVNLLEFCKQQAAGFVLLSTSRVYSIRELAQLSIRSGENSFQLDESHEFPRGFSSKGVAEDFSTSSPISLYGATKLASEALALEYGEAFGFPVWINRCGVMAGAGQFGRADQGIFAFWLHSWRQQAKLKYIGFEGTGLQVRDCLHPLDLADLLTRQMQQAATETRPQIFNVSGGISSATSLAQLSAWCEQRWGAKSIEKDLTPRKYDLPWIVLDHSLATEEFGWSPKQTVSGILNQIAEFADEHPEWLELSS